MPPRSLPGHFGVTAEDVVASWTTGWLEVLTEIKNRGIEDVCIVVCDGLKGPPESINPAWPLATVRTCIIHLIRNTFRFASRHFWEEMGKDLRSVYTDPTEAAALERFEELDTKWGGQYPAISKLWRNAWSEFVPLLDRDVEIRRIICSTNAIESRGARYRRAATRSRSRSRSNSRRSSMCGGGTTSASTENSTCAPPPRSKPRTTLTWNQPIRHPPDTAPERNESQADSES